jgi:hypothetical protein
MIPLALAFQARQVRQGTLAVDGLGMGLAAVGMLNPLCAAYQRGRSQDTTEGEPGEGWQPSYRFWFPVRIRSARSAGLFRYRA